MRYETYHVDDTGIAKIMATASRMGYDGVVCKRSPEAASVGTEQSVDGDIDLVDAIVLDPEDPDQASGLIGTYRSACELLVIRGGSPELNRFAVEQPTVDVLTAPMAGDGDLNHVMTRTAAENKVRIELSLHPVIHASGGRRVRAIQKLRKATELIKATDAQWTVTASPTDPLEFRDWRSVVALGATIGIGEEFTQTGITEWNRLITRNREGKENWHIEPGVYRGRYDDLPR